MSQKISEEKKTIAYLAYPSFTNTELSNFLECSIPWLEKFAKKQGLKKLDNCSMPGQQGYPLDLTGLKFGKLTVKTRCDYKVKNNIVWQCQCECGALPKYRSSLLRKGFCTSCPKCIRMIEEPLKKKGERGSWVWSKIRSHATERGIPFNISCEYALSLFDKQGGRCALSGIEISIPRIRRNKSLGTASLDRIDNSKGYEIGNVQWVHKRVNEMKNKHDEKSFIEFCHVVSDYQRAARK